MKAQDIVKLRIKGKIFKEMEVGNIICLSFGELRERDIPYVIKSMDVDRIRLERWKPK